VTRLALHDRAVARRSPGVLEEVVITATRRAQRIEEVPISVAVSGRQEIERRGSIGMEDYLRSIPGVNQVDIGTRSNAIVIRGISTSPTFENFTSSATVATYFDETPITGAGGIGAGGIDVRPVDIERIEVLRGPQGTAFGSGSLSGTLRIIPARPDPATLGGRVTASYSGTAGYGSGNSMIQGILNLPIVHDAFALRAVGYRYSQSGFYRNVAGLDQTRIAFADRPGLGADYVRGFVRDDIGRTVSTGGRFAADWRPTDELSLRASFLTQKIEQDGFPAATIGKYEQALIPVAPQGRVRGEAGDVGDTHIDLLNLVVDYDLPSGTVTSAISHVDSGSDLATDLWGFSFPASSRVPSHFASLTAQTRFVSRLPGPLQLVAGVFYEDVDERDSTSINWPGTPATSPVGTNPMLYQEISRALVQRALFGEVSYELTSRLDASVGGRYSRYRKSEQNLTEGGLFRVPIGAGVPLALASGEGTTNFKASLGYELREDARVYASWAEGFRLGRPTVGLPASTCDVDNDGLVDDTRVPIASTRSIRSDSLDNYEIGAKLSFFGRRMLLDLAAYRMEWRGLPSTVTVACSPQVYTANAGAARSDGLEFQSSVLAAAGLTIGFGGAYTDARLTENAADLQAPAGARLPGSPRFTVNLSAQSDFGAGGRRAFVRGDAFYTGRFYGDLTSAASSAAGDYVHVDARAGITFGNLDVEIFVRNLTNEDAFTFKQTLAGFPFFGNRLRPRTVGLQLGYQIR
jgi:iron complex outermembrane recepter protein